MSQTRKQGARRGRAGSGRAGSDSGGSGRAESRRAGKGRPGSTRGGRRARSSGRDRFRYRRALRREAPVVVGLLLDDQDFALLTAHSSFPFEDYGEYLHHLNGLLRSLHAQGTHIAVGLFDPDDYDRYCDSTRRPPDSPATRAGYVAEVTAAGPAVPYTRQPMPLLRSQLAREADRRATWERATDALMDAGPCPECGQDLAHCAFDRASDTLLRIVEAVGPGAHHIVCSLPAAEGPPLLAAVQIDADPDGEMQVTEADALVVCTVMAAGTISVRPGGLVVRTTDPDGTETVRGWSLREGEPYPLSEAEVFSAYCTDPATGEPVPPEHGVVYRAGMPLPPPSPAPSASPPPSPGDLPGWDGGMPGR
ncbi:hypothetical protein GA0115240_14803 [Streptomyces sp. DvalAA-14]|uniref:hypothetical protein n=1 Tax=unclassified Streptomyces TaxID=2593676 RepID=UPI00081BC364|nr:MULTISPECIES: hypothetical protein [unclassified Streptomyces]SCE27988.1 hypothetical protein GA0115240_14803 [Streptomyces sp. DvalAA-14]